MGVSTSCQDQKKIIFAWYLDGTVLIKHNDVNFDTEFDGTVVRVTSVIDLPALTPLPEK